MKSILKWGVRIFLFGIAVIAIQDEIARYFGHGDLSELASMFILVPGIFVFGYVIFFWDSFSDRFLSDPWLGGYQNSWVNKPHCHPCESEGVEYSVDVSTELNEWFGKHKEYSRKAITEHTCRCSNGHEFVLNRMKKY